MAITTGNQAQVLLDGFNLHQFAKSFGVNADIDILDASVLGTTSRIKLPGLKHATANSETFSDDTLVTGSYVVLKGKYGAASPGLFTYAPLGFALGNPSILMSAHQVSFQHKSLVGDLNMITMNAEAAEDAVDFGISLHALSAETVFPFDGTSVDNAVLTSNGGVFSIHATAFAGASPDLDTFVQHSTNNTVWVDLAQVSIAAASPSGRAEVAAGTTVNRYLRVRIVEAGTTTSVTFQASFARR